MKTEIKRDDDESCQSTNNPSEWKGRTIEIDDAGTGDLVGDAFIGFRDTETGKIIFQSVPVGFYNEDNKDDDRPRKHIVKIVIKALRELKHSKEDRILLCRGNCFDLVREYFNVNDIYYEPAIIEGELQDAVEGRFIQHLRKLGVNSDIRIGRREDPRTGHSRPRGARRAGGTSRNHQGRVLRLVHPRPGDPSAPGLGERTRRSRYRGRRRREPGGCGEAARRSGGRPGSLAGQ